MPLESTMLIIDNSEYIRNGDYIPSRWEAQSDAITTVFQTKIDSNAENTVGVMTMAGKGPEVLVTHSKELGQVLKAIHDTSNKIGGCIDITTSIAIAQLALKHRENKQLKQRIIVFVASPLEGPGADEKGMIKLAKKLKKNNVAIDVVAFGDGIEEGANNVLKSFIEEVSSGDNSHLVSVPPGTHLLSDVLISSPILAGDRAAGIPEDVMADVAGPSGVPATGGDGFEFGVDPTLDPELAMALRMSMQEEQARQAAQDEAQRAQDEATSSSNPEPTVTPATAAPTNDKPGGKDVEMNTGAEAGPDEDEEMDEEEAIAKAIEMSMKGQEEKHE